MSCRSHTPGCWPNRFLPPQAIVTSCMTNEMQILCIKYSVVVGGSHSHSFSLCLSHTYLWPVHAHHMGISRFCKVWLHSSPICHSFYPSLSLSLSPASAFTYFSEKLFRPSGHFTTVSSFLSSSMVLVTRCVARLSTAKFELDPTGLYHSFCFISLSLSPVVPIKI